MSVDRSGKAHLESVTEDYLYLHAKKRGGRAFKWTPTIAGVPDRMVLLPGGVIVFVELKQQGEKPTAVQEVWHARLRALGFRVEVIDSKAGVDALLDELA